METKMIKSYIRHYESNQPFGVVVAVNDNGVVRFGYSLVNDKVDSFRKDLGTEIAVARSKKHVDLPLLPDLGQRRNMVKRAYKGLYDRAVRYFKDCDVIPVGE